MSPRCLVDRQSQNRSGALADRLYLSVEGTRIGRCGLGFIEADIAFLVLIEFPTGLEIARRIDPLVPQRRPSSSASATTP
jgi:hypothetical protein